MPTQNRNNAYYEDRLRLEHPAVHADFLKGIHRTLANALMAAGMRKPRSRLQELQNAWGKATQPERDVFLRHVGATQHIATIAAVAAGTFLLDQRLTPPAIAAIRRFLQDRNITMGGLMALIGRKALDQSVSLAVMRDTKIQPDLGADLETLLTAQGYWAKS